MKINCMDMVFDQRITFYGGYGEHGRSCFVIERKNGRFIMVDCGILDTDPNPYPNVPKSVLENTDYMLLTHCHKDHTGAVQHFIEKGFQGTIIAEEITFALYHIEYEKKHILRCEGITELIIENDILVRFGRSGHCPGSLWFYLELDQNSYLFTGDYQMDTLVNSVDAIENIEVDIAVVDCGHEDVMESAKECRDVIIEKLDELLHQGKTILMPTQQYGRGVELLWLIKERFPEIRCMADDKFIKLAKQSLTYGRSYCEECMDNLKQYVESVEEIRTDTCGIIFLSDTHFAKKESVKLFNSLAERAVVMVTGRVKENGVIEDLLHKKQGILLPYCHHQSEYDLKNFIKMNNCKKVYPYHGHKKRVF